MTSCFVSRNPKPVHNHQPKQPVVAIHLVKAKQPRRKRSMDAAKNNNISSYKSKYTLHNEQDKSPDSAPIARLRSYSSCSSDSSYIEFSCDAPLASTSHPEASDEDEVSTNVHIDARASDAESDSSEDEGDDDEEDWDVLDSAQLSTHDDLLASFSSPMALSSLQKTSSVSPQSPPSSSIALPNGSLNPSEDSSPREHDAFLARLGSERFPRTDASPEVATRLLEVNLLWSAEKVPSCDRERDSKVTFSPAEKWQVINECPEMAEALHEARCNLEFTRRKADLERMERLLRPILMPEHRKKVFERIYANGEQHTV